MTLNNIALKETKQYKYLGLTITNKLSWAAYIENVMSNISSMLGSKKRYSYLINNKAGQFLYNSFVEPHLRYLFPCWANAPKNLLKKLRRLQIKIH